MITIKINAREVEVEEGTSVMKAAQQIGIDVPNLCWNDELDHFTSCMLCIVKDNKTGRLFPSCSIRAKEGMDIITDDQEVIEARQMALELLLSEHVGDCEAPCQIACPAHMNIPMMNRLIAAGETDKALGTVRRDIALPAVLGRICPAPCEGACHRKTIDEAVSVCLLKRFVGDEGVKRRVPETDTGKKVAVIGAGPAGLSAAYYLRQRGVRINLFDENEQCGGQLRSEISHEILPPEILDREIDIILKTGVEFLGGKKIGNSEFEEIIKDHDAVVVATGNASDESEHFGLGKTDKGIAVKAGSYQTTIENVFAIGNALRSSRLAVRSAGQGKEVAFSVWQYLNGMSPVGEPRMFNSRFGRLVPEEYEEYLRESTDKKRLFPEGNGHNGFSAEMAVAEAARCLHCDCRAIDNCKLRIYCDKYTVDQRRFRTSERLRISKLNMHSSLIYEPQKCIKCGICVGLAEKYGERFGFTYIGRGFDVEIGIPFNEELEKALTVTALKIAHACPTGAIELK